MEGYNQRSRSNSASRIQQHHSPSPRGSYQDLSSTAGLDPSINNHTFTTGKFNANNFEVMDQNPFNSFNFPSGTDQPQYMQQGNLTGNEFYSNGQMQGQFQSEQMPSSGFNAGTNLDNFIDPTGGQGGDSAGLADFANQNNFDQSYLQQSQFPDQYTSQALNQQNLSHMSSPHIGTPQNLLSPDDHTSPSPVSSTGHYYTPQHSRHESLDPSSAAYPQGQEWSGVTFQQHRRMQSEQSDISSSAAPSPYLAHQDQVDSFDNNHSPSMIPLPDTNDFANAFGMENINLADQNRTSPFHSAHASPRLAAQQTQGLGLGQEFSLNSNVGQMNGPGPEIFTSNVDSALQRLHEMTSSGASDMGQANQFPVPTIDIEPAPVSRQASFEPEKGDPSIDALSPPSRGNRGRSKSDPHMSRPISRSASPGAGHVRSPSLAGAESLDSHSIRSLSPMAPLSTSRDHSPGAPNRVDKNRRSSTSSLPSRDYILDLADPERPNASPNAGNARVQKHPATFQCHLCPKRFTRAYNLRSHLRTHTDERPFVCTVCGKAFARQHDRKRHEGLHSGEKKFVCKGELLSSGGTWGCGRRFARADALGRHFRSEAGRVCIKPLLDEEAAERDRQRAETAQQQAQAMHQQQAQMHQQMSSAPMDLLQPVQQPLVVPSQPATTATGGQQQQPQFMLPAALLAQYPALNNIDWSTIAPGDPDPGELSDMGGGSHGSFDASSGGEGMWAEGELGDVEDDLSDYASGGGPEAMQPVGGGQQQHPGGPWA